MRAAGPAVAPQRSRHGGTRAVRHSGTHSWRRYCGGMAAEVSPPYWAKVVATFTGCASIGALVGLMGGALTQNVGGGFTVGVIAGVLVALGLVVFKPGRIRGE